MEKLLFSVLTILSICCKCSTFASVMNPNLNVDGESLLAFKSGITSDPFDILARNWTTSNGASFCLWIGVSCGPDNRITALDLHGWNLEGPIAPHLGNLTFLRYLDLSLNNFTGQIPEDLSGLRALEVLKLGSNNFTGSIPHGIFNISSLQVIDLANNKFKGTVPMDLCDNLSQLKVLELSWNSLSGVIPSNIYKCKSLETLSLSANEFTGSISKDIGELTMLKELILDQNNLKGGIPVEIGNLSQIEVLGARNNSISGEIPSAIFNWPSLRQLDISSNHLSGSLPLGIQLPNLELLSLQSNHLRGQIFPNLLHCRKLSILSLSNNEFTGAIPKQIGNLTQLKILDLGHNNMTGEIPWELGYLKLKELYIHTNGFSGSIPDSIFNMSMIEKLELFDNHFRGQLPRSMGTSLPNLRLISLNGNNLTGTIPTTLNNASNLAIISLGGNSFTGMVPNFGDLRRLIYLSLEKNNLIGGNPDQELSFISSLANCPFLGELDLSSNQLNGILPTSIGNLSKLLCYFSAHECHIKGFIPPTFGNLTGLKSVNLASNELTGLIPTTIGGLTDIAGLHLDHNRLQGHIPTEVCRLNRLRDLYLSDNVLNGTIPACFQDLKTLNRVYLDCNRLTSMVPNLWNISGLSALNLSTNFLNGNIPLEITNLTSLWDLDLSWNRFSGDIPENIGDLHTLEKLSFAHNNLQGSIPQSSGYLQGLVSLDLSDNNLVGYIPKSLESLVRLTYLDLSYNRLQGEIPNGGPFSNFTAQSFTKNDGLCGDVRLQVPPCYVKGVAKSSSKHVSFIAYILAPIVLAIVAVSLSIWLLQRRKANKKQHQVEMESIPSWRWIFYQELQGATKDFNEFSIIGRGCFGSVYKGVLSDGLNVAVKVFNIQFEEAIKSFDVECQVMSTIRHKNLVRVISCCSNPDFKALVLEYIHNGSLDKWLYAPNHSLDLLQRLNIAIDVALALEYLHHGILPPIIHCDLKPSNILIDEDMVAHVSDFGIAKIFGEGEAFHQTITFATIGYMAPEYGSQGQVSTNCDIYSFGITLLELFTGMKPTDDMFTEEMSLKDWVSGALLENRVTEIAAPGLLDQEDRHFSEEEQCILSIFDLAMKCLVTSPHARINMINTVVILKKIRASFPTRANAK